jgi:hypothetical protein
MTKRTLRNKPHGGLYKLLRRICMKNLYKLVGIIAFVAVIGFSMTACNNGGGNGAPKTNTDPKMLVITGVTDSVAGKYFHYEASGGEDLYTKVGTIWLYPAGTELPPKVDQAAWNMNAYANIDRNGETYTIPLMTPKWEKWTGTGKYDIWVFSDLTGDPDHGAVLRNVNFSETVTMVAWSSFKEEW